MLTALTQEQLPEALAAIRAQRTGAISIVIEGYLQGQIETDIGLEFLVDQWPSFSNIFLRTNSDYRYTFLKDLLACHSTDTGVMKEILKGSDILKGIETIFFANFPYEENEFYKELFQFWQKDVWSMNHLYKTDMLHLQACQLAEGYSECTVMEVDAELINETWEHKGENSIDLVKFQIRHFPSVGIKDINGQLVAWEITYFIGCVGMLYVLPEHRGKGLAQYVTYKLCKELIQQGRNAFCFVENWNTASKRLHEKCGFYEEPGTESLFAIVRKNS